MEYQGHDIRHDAEGMEESYLCPSFGLEVKKEGNTMPKAGKEVGGMLEEVRTFAKVPGPDAYNKDFLDTSFSSNAKGGTFTHDSREYRKKGVTIPSVGHYETSSPHCEKRIMGGLMSKTARTCYFIERATKHQKDFPSPGKYDSVALEAHTAVPRFAQTKTETRMGPKPPPVGPGSYSPNFSATEKASPKFSVEKEETKSFLDHYLKMKEKVPAPAGFPASRYEDTVGRRRHMVRLLGDRIVTPRTTAAAATSNPASPRET